MDVVYQRQTASVSEVHGALEDAPSYSSVRALMRVLVDKGHLVYEQDGPRYIYRPTVPREVARKSAMRRVLDTFFDGRPVGAVATLIDESELDGDDLDGLQRLIDAARAGR